MYTINIYKPAELLEIPRERIGSCKMSYETWEQVNGYGKYADSHRMEIFRVHFMPLLNTRCRSASISVTEQVLRVHCRAIPIYKNHHYVNFRAIIELQSEREFFEAHQNGTWYA